MGPRSAVLGGGDAEWKRTEAKRGVPHVAPKRCTAWGSRMREQQWGFQWSSLWGHEARYSAVIPHASAAVRVGGAPCVATKR
eukprot:8018058-Pyramimonas_sp.AAC.1